MEPNAKGRFRGCLLGLAIGDAVGTTVEFQPRGSFKPVTDMISGGLFPKNPHLALLLYPYESRFQRLREQWREGDAF